MKKHLFLSSLPSLFRVGGTISRSEKSHSFPRLRALMLTLLFCAVGSVAWGDVTPTVLFHETFGNNTSSARDWNDSYSVKSGVSAVYSGVTGYSVTNAKQGKNTTGSTQSGLNQSSSGTDAVLIIGPLNVASYNTLSLTYQWKAASIKGTYSTSLYYATSSTGEYTSVSGSGNGATSFVERSYSLPAAAQVSTLYLKIVWNTSNTQAIIDEVELKGVLATVPATSISLDQTSATLVTGGTVTLTPTVGPDGATDKTVSWTTSASGVATVSNGVVTAVAPGTATITASANGGTSVTKTCAITVKPVAPTFSVAEGSFGEAFNLELSAEAGATIYYTTNGVAPTDESTEYSGAIAIPAATTTVKAIAVKNGQTSAEASATYTYSSKPVSFSIPSSVDLKVLEEGGKIIVTTSSTGAITMTSSDDTGLEVDNSDDSKIGVLSPYAEGTYTVHVAIAEDATYRAAEGDVTVNVTKTATSITIDDELINYTDLNDGTAAGALGATVTPDGGAALSSPVITWTSSNTSVATIAADGTVTLVGPGNTTITASYAGDDIYEASNKTYVLTVTDSRPGYTAEHPYTVAQAIYAIDNSGKTSGVYVAGIVSTAGTLSSGSITYYISDDGTKTTEFEVYKGKGVSGADFEASGDIAVGDEVVIYGDIKLYGVSTYEFNTGSQLVSKTRKTVPSLAFDDDDLNDGAHSIGVTTDDYSITATTNSDAAIVYSSSDETVATINPSTGAVDLIMGGTTTIRASVAATATYQGKTISVVLTVNDDRTAVVSSLDLGISALAVEATGSFAATSTLAAGATKPVTYTYSTEGSLLSIDGAAYTVGTAVGDATVKVIAMPDNADKKLFKPVEGEFEVTITAPTSIVLSENSDVLTYNTAKEITATLPAGYDGELSATVSPVGVATATVDGSTITITPVKMYDETVTVTVTASAGAKYYTGTDSKNFTFTLNKIEGAEDAPALVDEVFYESFDACSTSGGNDGNWSTGSGTISASYATGLVLSSKSYGASKCVRLGTGSDQGSATVTISAIKDEEYTLTYKQAPWSSESTTKSEVTVTGGTITGISTDAMGTEKWTDFTGVITASATGDLVIVIASTGSKRFFLDEIKITKPAALPTVSLNASGYATYCSEYPMDFSEAEGYTAWAVTGVTSAGVMTFTKVTGAVKGGQGVLLKGAESGTATIKFNDSSKPITGNMLKGTLAPTYFADDAIYGLSGDTFVKNTAGTIKANKAYLDATDIPADARSFTFVFNDETTGISTVEHQTLNDSEQMYNLRGQKVNQNYKGVVIVNGRKVVMK